MRVWEGKGATNNLCLFYQQAATIRDGKKDRIDPITRFSLSSYHKTARERVVYRFVAVYIVFN